MATRQKPPKPGAVTRGRDIPEVVEVNKLSFWKLFWIILFAGIVLFTLGYGVWRLMGGSFKPQPVGECADAAKRAVILDPITANPTDFTAQLKYADFEYGCREFAGAITNYSKAVQVATQPNAAVTKTDRLKAQLGLGFSYFYNQNLKEAQAELKKYLDEEPDKTLALYVYGYALKADDPAKAIEQWQKVIKLVPAGDNLAVQSQKAIDEAKIK
ncbi:tetratricopeptide repeat protein [Candidatus Chlorohelix sp.]|uniref:tetratricopeptide repeat protein n=1 Tax=Candidatus Chlorohelix sp. TaxID=3139201 RepID=UPI00306B1307